MLRSQLVERVLLGVLRFWGYRVVSHLPVEWLRWLRSRTVPKDLLKRLQINCVFDVGANRGQFGTMLRQAGYRGWILSFEPVRANLAVLERVAAAAPPWRVFPYALGANNGHQKINVTHETVFSSFLTPRQESQTRFPQNRVVGTEEVEVRRLDGVFDTCIEGIPSPRVYLKLDTQGFDLEVARGAESVLDRVLALQTEISFRPIYIGMPGFAASISHFQDCGFEVVDFIPVTWETDQLRAVEMDCVMVRELK
jgi:FkbM family methyltransferase